MPVPDTLQLSILKDLTALLEGIDGIEFSNPDIDGPPVIIASLQGNVFRGRTVFGDEEKGPFVSILEDRQPDDMVQPASSDDTLRLEDWRLLLQGFMEDESSHPLDNLYYLKGLVEQRLARIVALNERGYPVYPDNYMLDGKITKMRIGPGAVRPASPVTGGMEAFYLPVVIEFAMNVVDPFQGA